MAVRYVEIGQYPDVRREVRGTLAEILVSTANPGTYAAPEDVTGCFLEMGADGKWDGASVGSFGSVGELNALPTAYLALGARASVLGVQYTYGAGGWVALQQTTKATNSVTAAGSYVGTGSILSVSIGFRPDLVIVRADAANPVIMRSRTMWAKQSNPVYALDSQQAAIYLDEYGFSVGTDTSVNTAATTYHWFAFCDNGSNSFRTANWQGNALDGRVVSPFQDAPSDMLAAMIKRDNTLPGIWVPNGFSAYSDDSYAAYGASSHGYAEISGKDIILSNATSVNQWSGVSGEGTECMAWFRSPDVFVTTFRGNGLARNLPLPFDPACVIITRPGGAAFWTETMGDSVGGSRGNLALESSVITKVAPGLISIPAGSNANSSGTRNLLIAFRNNRTSPYTTKPRHSTRAVLELNSGYISCGTSDTLKISGPLTLEWYGIPHLYGAPNELPLMFRSNGADGSIGSASFGMTLYKQSLLQNTLLWEGYAPVFCRTNYFQVHNPGTNLSLDAANTGIAVDDNALVHYILTTDGNGVWNLYKDGIFVKDVSYDMAQNSLPNVSGGAGHTMMIGARKAASIVGASVMGFCRARIFSRMLSSEEALTEFASAVDGAPGLTDYLEEWDAKNAVPVNAPTSLPATRDPTNNGTITNGTLFTV